MELQRIALGQRLGRGLRDAPEEGVELLIDRLFAQLVPCLLLRAEPFGAFSEETSQGAFGGFAVQWDERGFDDIVHLGERELCATFGALEPSDEGAGTRTRRGEEKLFEELGRGACGFFFRGAARRVDAERAAGFAAGRNQ